MEWTNEYSLKEVLDWINRERVARGVGEPLATLPRGNRDNGSLACGCPVARALGADGDPENYFNPIVDGTFVYFYPDNRSSHLLNGNGVELPETVRMFISDFDCGRYPELVLS